MAKQHKAPTQVSIAPLSEKSGLQETVERYWKPAALAFVAIAFLIIFSQFQSQKERTAADDSWNTLAAVIDIDQVVRPGGLPEPSVLGPLADALRETETGPWAMVLEARSLIDAGEYERARAVLDEMEKAYPDHALVSAEYRSPEAGETAGLLARMRENARARAESEASHPRLESPPEVPDGSPQVRIETDRGPIVVGLYADRAPQHVENFLKLCREGYYDGTRFHRVVEDLLIQGGDPNTRDAEDVASWGQGGPGYTIPPEITDAWHFRGMLAAAKEPGEIESSGSQFYITAQDARQFDKQHTVFGRVLEGMDLVEEIAAETSETERPANPAVVESTTVVES
jgi:cyclophilin family peptidyl-prolyl cis-trans isomerase